MTAAGLPPGFRLAGVDPAWSRIVQIPDATGSDLAVHVLDSWNGRDAEVPELTLLCVHGNPTWSFLWRRVLALAPTSWRVVAVDQVGMGFSQRPAADSAPRRLAQRVDDLGQVTQALGLAGPVVTIAHDWGGPVSLGWALAHPDLLAGVVLTNTAVTQPPGSPAPALIRAVSAPGVLNVMTVTSPGFVNGTLRLSRPALPREVRAGFRAPYPTAASRRAVGDFVADIPLGPEHPSFAALEQIAEGVRSLTVPVLLLWGPEDPVFSDLYLTDLLERMPHADVHRYEGASHLVTEDAPAAIPDLLTWLREGPRRTHRSTISSPVGEQTTVDPARRTIGRALADRRNDDTIAVAQLGSPAHTASWRLLNQRVDELAGGFSAAGVRKGDRVALLVPPGADLTACVYALWIIGAVVVVADAGLGPRGIRRALRGATPRHLIAIPRGLAAVRALRVQIPGLRIVAGSLTPAVRALGASLSLAEVATAGRNSELPQEQPAPDDQAVVVFTSGATGPSKGVVYTHSALEAQRDALRALYSISETDSLVAAFAPWAVLGPALGIATAVPAMDVTSPGTLTAQALADAVAAVNASMVWASPAALRSVLRTDKELSPVQCESLAGVRLVMSAGAPVPASLLERATSLFPNASVHTPYGMTEVLPVADISLQQLRAVGPGNGVCVGWPVPGVTLAVSPLNDVGEAFAAPSQQPEQTGEVLVSAPHGKLTYDRLWSTEAASSRDAGWHRTGDVGHVDHEGRLWIEGRLPHVITTPVGPVTPVGIELAVESLAAVEQAAVVGVGPAGTQQLVVVVVTVDGARGPRVPLEMIDAVRAVVSEFPVSAVLRIEALPVDRRHNSKIDRAEVARWAGDLLAGNSR